MSVLVLVEHGGGAVKDATLAAVTAAGKLGEVDALVVGAGVDMVAQAVARIAGVAKVLVADDPAYVGVLAENVAPLVVEIMVGYDVFVVADTSGGKNIAPRVAALLDVMQISSVLSIEGDRFMRPIYAGNAIATVTSSDRKKVLTVRATAFDKAAAEGGAATIEAVAGGGGDAGLSVLLSQETAASDRPELTSAKVVVSGGRALGSAEQFKALLEPLADRLHAAVGASRAAVDAGFIGNDHQVGQTGKIVAPEVYVAIGISGAIQHLAGMKDAKVIIAINRDADAPIFQVADLGLVGDLFTLVPELTAKLG